MRGDGGALVAEDHRDLLIALAARDPVQDGDLARGEMRARDLFRGELVDPQMRRLRDAVEDRQVGMRDAVLVLGHGDREDDDVLARAEGGQQEAVGQPVFARGVDEELLVGGQPALDDVENAYRPPRACGEPGERVELGETVAIVGDEALGKAEGADLAAPRVVARGAGVAERGESLRAVEGARDREHVLLARGGGDLPDGLAVIHLWVPLRYTRRKSACPYWMSFNRTTCKGIGFARNRARQRLRYRSTAPRPIRRSTTWNYVVHVHDMRRHVIHSDDYG